MASSSIKNIWTLIYILTCSIVLITGSGRKFDVEGKITLPPTGVYSNIPDGTCLRMKVVDAIQCGWRCTIPKRGSLVMTNFTVTNNEIPFRVPCEGGYGMYYISAYIHYGWCSDGSQSIKKGDYHNEFLEQFRVETGQTLKENVIVRLTYYVKESFSPPPPTISPPSTQKPLQTTQETTKPLQTTQPTLPPTLVAATDDLLRISGSLHFPSNGVYTRVPKGSCLRLILKPNVAIMCIRAPCVIPAVASLTLFDKDIKFDGNKIHYQMKTAFRPDFYVLRAILNVGWCSIYDEDYPTYKWLYGNDYHSDSRSTFIVDKNGGKRSFDVDIRMMFKDRYMCGEDHCYKTEKCEKEGDNYRCKCNIAVKCALSYPESWFCGSDGRSYRSECEKNSADCFSDTIQKLHNGKCKAGYDYSSGHYSGDEDGDGDDGKSGHSAQKTSILVGAFASIFVGIMLLVAIFMRHRRQRSPVMSFSNDAYSVSPYGPMTNHPTLNKKEKSDVVYVHKEGVKKERVENIYSSPPVMSGMDAPPPYETIA